MEAGPEKLLPQKIEAQDRLIRFAKGQMQNEKHFASALSE
jgi:hypothetical protein